MPVRTGSYSSSSNADGFELHDRPSRTPTFSRSGLASPNLLCRVSDLSALRPRLGGVVKRNALIAATLAALSAPPAGATGITLENVQITSYQLGAAAGDQPRLPAALGQAVDKIGIPNEETRPMMPKAVPAEPVGVYNQTTGAFFLKNTNTPGTTHPNGVNFVLFDGSVRF